MSINLEKHKIAKNLSGQAVVIIDPAANSRQTMKQYLHGFGVREVVALADAEIPLEEVVQSRVGLVISEWSLKDKNGLQLCRELRSQDRYKHVPFLLISSEYLRSDIILASEVGIDGYLLKPFSFEAFRAQIQRLASQKSNGVNIHLYLDVADENIRGGQQEAALELYHKVLSIAPNSARAWCGLGNLDRLAGNDHKALECYRKAIAANPSYITAIKEMLEIYDRQGDLHGSLHALQKLHAESPDNPSYTLQSALVYLRLGFLRESEEAFRKTIRLSPKMASAHRGLGDVYMRKEDYETAMKHYHKALDLDSGDIKTLNGLGLSLVRLGRYQEGIAKYTLALQLDPNHPGLHFNIGYAYEKQEDFQAAREHYGRALIADPNFDKAKRRIEGLVGKKGSIKAS